MQSPAYYAALSAPIDEYGYRARAAREGLDHDARRAPERIACAECHERFGVLVYNASDRVMVCAACDLAIDEAVRIAAEEALAELEANEPRCTCTQTDVDIFDARGCELHDSRSAWNARQRAVTMSERYEQWTDGAWCYWCDRPRNDCACHLDPSGLPDGHWSLAVRKVA